MRRHGASPPAESASRGSRGDTHGGFNSQQHQSFSFGNTCGPGGRQSESDRPSRQARRQARCAADRRRRAFEELRGRVRGFSRSAKKSLRKSKPTNEDLRRFVDQAYTSTSNSQLQQRLQERALQMNAAEIKQAEIMKALDRDWAKKGHGWVPLEKPDGTTRLILENWNSIKYWSERQTRVDVNVIEATRKRYNADMLLGVEHQVNFSKAPQDAQFHDLFGLGEDRKSAEAHNRHNRDHRSAYGGTAMMIFGRLSNYAKSAPDRDETGLGRWCSLVIKSQSKVVRVVVAYRPNKDGRGRRTGRGCGAGSVWRQHQRYFRALGRAGNPRQLFDTDLLASLRSWKEAGEEIILAGDFNDNVYTSSLARALRRDDIGLKEQYHALYDEEAPFSYHSGSEPVMGVFATAGVEVKAALLSPHKVKGTVGDHRLHIFDFATTSITGIDEPTITRSEGRNLQYRHHYARVQYTKVLMQLTRRHKMFVKAQRLAHQRLDLSASEFQVAYNRYDKELVELMLGAEKRCRKKKVDFLEWSPIVGTYLRQLHVIRWMLRFKHGRKTNQSNLKRACRTLQLPDPVQTTLAEAQDLELVWMKKLHDLRESAPQHRIEHLQSCIDSARQVGDDDKVQALIKIMRKERERKKYRRLYSAFGKKKGNPPSRIAVPNAAGPDPIYSGRENVETVAAEHLTQRYTSAHSSPFATGKLLDDVGHLGAGPAVSSILDGTYEFPPEYDDHAKAICRAAAKIFARTSEEAIDIHITRKEFQEWWLTANEDIQSSKSGCHFSHYKVAAENDYLSALHVARLNLALETGIPYERWGHGVTVLLEKEFGSIYINKLRAICLFEADFNWLQKIIFAKRMIGNARKTSIIPPEQCATPGVDANQGSMMKILHCDVHRTLHVPYSVVSADLANCYDAVNHAVAALALLCFGVPHMAIKLVLTCLQSMFFWLRTAFGISATPFHGTAVNPFFGISQGGGFAPPTFQAVSALMINAYKDFGHGVQFISPVTGTVLFFAAVLYVDDTDLLLRADTPECTDEEFFGKIQRAVRDWARIVMVTGGSLKPAKCHASIGSFKYVNGVAKLKTSRSSNVTLLVPQKDAPDETIDIIKPTDSKKTLGVKTNLAGCGSDQLQFIEQKGLDWADKLRTNKYVTGADGWHSFNTQLKPKLLWGSVCLVGKPDKVDDSLARVHHKSLSRLGVHRNIRRELRTMPEMFQGLGMFDLNVERLGAKIHFLRRHWNSNEAMGLMVRNAYETFQLDIGLHGNIFTRSFAEFSHLSADNWFYDLWRLCDHFEVSLIIHDSHDVPLLRDGDRALMECFISLGLFSDDQLDTLARFRKYFRVYSLAELLTCDGCTVDRAFLSYHRHDSTRVYPYEKPRRKDLDLWISALRLVTSPSLVLDQPLGQYLITPPNHTGWYANNDISEVYHLRGDFSYDVYSRTATERRHRHPTFTKSHLAEEDEIILARLASVEAIEDVSITLQSSTLVPSHVDSRTSFLDTLHSWPNQSLWKYFKCDGDGEWIRRAIILGTLTFVHDGSYMRQVAPKLCSAGFVLSCSRSGMQATGTLVEYNDSANNYRAEALGAAAGLLVIKAATERCFNYLDVVAHCDNMGIVKHGNSPGTPCPEKQVHADLIILIKKLIQGLPCRLEYKHVFGHLDEILRWDQLSLVQKLNVLCDSLAKRALMAAIVNRDFIDSGFPFEDIVMMCGPSKVVSSPVKGIYQWWGYRVARDFFHSKKIIDKTHFDLIHWEGMGAAMKSFPVMFRRWITKHVSGFCGCNEHLAHYVPDLSPKCSVCDAPRETTAHITVCQDPARTSLYTVSVDSTVSWMKANDTAPLLLQLIESYLRARGSKTMSEIAPPDIGVDYDVFVQYQDILGWQNFIEGRFLRYMVQLQREYLSDRDTWRTAETWARGLIEQLLRLTHRQWLHRNAILHFRLSDGRTIAERESLIRRVQDLMWTDPEDLLPDDRPLLEEDFVKLGEANADAQAYWAAEVEAALKAAAYERGGDRTRDDSPYVDPVVPRPPLSRPAEEPQVDTEGSIRYRRRRRK